MTYWQITIIFALMLGVFSAFVALAPVKWPGALKALPRHKTVGVILGFVCLVASAYYVLPMLEGGLSRFRPLVVLLVPVLTVLCYYHLDYLFARAFGGSLILCVNYMLHMAFVVDVPHRIAYALPGYALALWAMVLIATPWRLRNMLEKADSKSTWRWGISGVFGLLSLFYLTFSFAG